MAERQQEYILVRRPDRGLLKHIAPTDISDRHCSDCKNVWFDNGLIRKRFGFGAAKTVKDVNSIEFPPTFEIAQMAQHTWNASSGLWNDAKVLYAIGLTGVFIYDKKNDVWHEFRTVDVDCNSISGSTGAAQDGPSDLTQTVGSGLDDVVIGNVNDSAAAGIVTLTIKIVTAAGTDQIRWSDDGFSSDNGINTDILGSDQNLVFPTAGGSVFIRFDAITGHTLNDEWECQCAPGSTNATTLDATNKIEGTASIKVTVGGVHTTGTVVTFASNVNLQIGRYVSLWIRTDTALSTGDLQYVLWDSTESTEGRGTYDKTNGSNARGSIPAVAADGDFHRVVVDFGSQHGSDFVSPKTHGIRMAVDKGAIEFQVDDIILHSIGMSSTATEAEAVQTSPTMNSINSKSFAWVGYIEVPLSRLSSVSSSTPTIDGSASYNTTRTTHVARDIGLFKTQTLICSLVEESSGNDIPVAQKLRWSDATSSAEWAAGIAGFQQQTDSDGDLLAIQQSRDNVYLFAEDAVIRQTFIGETILTMGFEYVYEGEGLLAPRLSHVVNGSVYWAGHNNIYQDFEADNFIGDAVKDDFLGPAGINFTSGQFYRRSFIMPIKDKDLLVFMVPTSASYPDAGWPYDYVEKTWTYWDYAGQNITASVSFEDIDEETTGFPFSSASTWTRKHNSGVMIGTSAGTLHEMDFTHLNDNGVAIDAFWDSKEFSITETPWPEDATWTNIWFKAKGEGNAADSVTVSVNIDGGGFNVLDSQALTSTLTTYNMIINKGGKSIIIRFSDNTLSSTFAISDFAIHYTRGGIQQ